MPEGKPNPEEDELDELPPIDGDGGDDEEPSPEDLEDDAPEDGGDPFDDSTGDGDPVEDIEVSGEETGWLEDAGDSEGLDVGTPATFGEEDESPTLLEGAEEPDVGEEDLVLGGEEGSFVGDAGEEGFEDEEEDLREEDLPRLDADEEGSELEDGELADSIVEEEPIEESRPVWDDRAWERVEGGPHALAAVDTVACAADAVFVGGQGIARIDRAGKLTALEALGLRGGAPRTIASDGDRLLVSTPRAGVLLSRDGGRSFSEANGWRALTAERVDGPLDLVLVGDELWGRTRGGALVFSPDYGQTWSTVLPERRFEAIAADVAARQVVALGREGAAGFVARGSAGSATVSSVGVLPSGAIAAFAAYGGELALRVPARGAFRAEGGAWVRLEGSASSTALAFVRDDGTLAVALHAEGEGRAWLVEARPGGPARTVAELGEPARRSEAGRRLAEDGAEDEGDGDDARVRSLAWDGVAWVVWAGGAFGLLGFRPARVIRPRTG